jgi:hypothetical protein
MLRWKWSIVKTAPGQNSQNLKKTIKIVIGISLKQKINLRLTIPLFCAKNGRKKFVKNFCEFCCRFFAELSNTISCKICCLVICFIPGARLYNAGLFFPYFFTRQLTAKICCVMRYIGMGQIGS